MPPREAMPLRSVNWWTVLKIAVPIVGAFLVAAGFGWRTPAQKAAEQDAKIASNAARIDTLAERQRDTNENFTLLFKLNCLDSHYSPRDLQLAGLNCPALLSPPVTQAGAPTTAPPMRP